MQYMDMANNILFLGNDSVFFCRKMPLDIK